MTIIIPNTDSQFSEVIKEIASFFAADRASEEQRAQRMDPRIGTLWRVDENGAGTTVYYCNSPVYREGTREQIEGFLTHR
jgi:hypothetical protein